MSIIQENYAINGVWRMLTCVSLLNKGNQGRKKKAATQRALDSAIVRPCRHVPTRTATQRKRLFKERYSMVSCAPG